MYCTDVVYIRPGLLYYVFFLNDIIKWGENRILSYRCKNNILKRVIDLIINTINVFKLVTQTFFCINVIYIYGR